MVLRTLSLFFATGPVKIKSKRFLGADKKHLKLFVYGCSKKLEKQSRLVEAVLWGKAQDFEFKEGDEIEIAFVPRINDFRGEKAVQLDIKDWKRVGQGPEEVFARIRGLAAVSS